jgi:uncharacterized damage-inducible protein DinB
VLGGSKDPEGTATAKAADKSACSTPQTSMYGRPTLCLNIPMDLIPYLTRLFEYDAWANREVLGNLRGLSSSQAQPLKLLAHILASQHLWMVRLEPGHAAFPVWPDLTLEECERQAAELHILWKDYLRKNNEASLAQTVDYKNSQGDSWSSRKDDILMHLVTHSAYHRGQIAAAVRAAGFAPAYTDFIHSIRQGFVK